MTRFKPYSATALALSGAILAGLGLYFAFLRPPLLPEDLRSIGASLALIESTLPGLLTWLQRVFRVMGGYIFATGVLTIWVALTSFRQRARWAFATVAVAGASSITLMVAVNFIIDSDFKWLLLGFALPWLLALGLYPLERAIDRPGPALAQALCVTDTMQSTARFPAAAPSEEQDSLRPVQLTWLAAAVFVVSAGYGALLPLLPGWLAQMIPGASAPNIASHVGFLSGIYTAGVLVGAPLWGVIADRVGLGRILLIGLVGYVASLLLVVVPGFDGLWPTYALRAMTGFFVAAVIPVVSAFVAEHTPEQKRARRFAWLGAMSLLGFLFGPALNAIAGWTSAWATDGRAGSAELSARIVIVISALLGAVMMLGLARTMPESRAPVPSQQSGSADATERPFAALCWLSGIVTFVLAGFELGIVLQGQEHVGVSPRQVAMMFAECSLVMLGINALLFFTELLEKAATRKVMAVGLVLAAAGLAVLAGHRSEPWVYLGISLTSAGTGLVLPVIAYLAAGTSRKRLGATMGGLAAAAGLGQTLGSALGGWLFGAVGQWAFGGLILPLIVVLAILLR